MMKVWMQGSLTRVAGMVGWFKETCRTLPNSGPASLGFRKFVCESSYGKNKDQIGSVDKVPDDAIQLDSKKWWMPHPQTGVFGPQDNEGVANGDSQHTQNMDGSSVLDQQAWFRPSEDVQKQPLN
ncbi:hypothetical protein SUGI_0499110 [Cryptomeria japonica]|uniref:late embryogenesis abundant protein At5g17165 n=1 Tax=Cryptomeria japonica TaxID=3369 RepID=UPI002408EC66|nr:late embryogenesis abundant protein At5g17165 [Cryptomeria japonica]GLJ26023.1 hypothetical protein SUGI_0499110 [Cryptomeria japonica]